MFRLINLCALWDAYHELVCVFKILCITDRGPRGTAVTKSLHWPWQDGHRIELNTHQELYLKENAHLRHLKTPLTYIYHLSEKWRVTECLKTSCMESLQLAGNLLAVCCFRGGYLQKHRNRTKGTIQTQNWPNGRISLDKGTRQRWCVRKETNFSFLIHCDSFALWCIVGKNKQILGFEEPWWLLILRNFP